MFRYKNVKQQLAEERRKNEELNAKNLEQQTLINELSDAVIELADIVAGEGEEVADNG